MDAYLMDTVLLPYIMGIAAGVISLKRHGSI